jgi:DNA polymerase III delta prime subunit
MIQRKIRFDLAEYDSSWKGCFVLFATDGFKNSIEFKKKISALNREAFLAERELKKLNSKLSTDATLGKESDPKTVKKEKDLLKRTDEIALEIIEEYQKLISKSFVSGQIFDAEKNSTRDLVREDMLDFDEAVLQLMVQAITGEITKKN